jgi:hypothetical protein
MPRYTLKLIHMMDYIARPSQFNKSQIISESEENNKKESIYTSVQAFFHNQKSNISADEICTYFSQVMVQRIQ